MIRRAVLAAFTACAVVGVSDIGAQTIGFKVGAAFADWSVDDEGLDVDTDAITTFMGGGFIRFGTGSIAFQPELLVVTRGTEFGPEADDDFDIGRYKLDYIEIPLLLMFRLNSGMGIAPYVIAGPSIAFEYGCKVEVEAGDFEDSADCDEQGSDVFERNKLDLGITGGLGLEFPLGPGALLVEGRYNFGLTNISDVDGLDIKSRTPAILAGYSIPLTVR